MIPVHLTDVGALFLMTFWASIWGVFIFSGRHSPRILPLNQHLVRYSTGLFFTITFFYTLLFTGVGAYEIFSNSDAQFLLGVAISGIGAMGMMLSRWYLRDLTLAEVIFAKNESTIHVGPYRYMRHPMYIGLSLILAGSLILYPNFYALTLLVPAGLLIERKMRIEDNQP